MTQRIIARMQSIQPFKQDAEASAWEAEQKELRTFKSGIAKEMGRPEQTLLAFEPTALTRTSPFFPMSKRDMGNRPMEQGLTWEHSWGRITVSGERLSVYDETVLLAMLVLVRKYGLYSFQTTRFEMCKVLGVSVGKDPYKAILDATDRLSKTHIQLQKRKGKKLQRQMGGSILADYDFNLETGKMFIEVNKFFREMFEQGLTTDINVMFRNKLKGDITKSLYRFFLSQEPLYKKGRYEIHILKLSLAINLTSENRPLFELRRQIRTGLKELKKHGYLTRSTVDKNDLVTVWKSQKTAIR